MKNRRRASYPLNEVASARPSIPEKFCPEEPLQNSKTSRLEELIICVAGGDESCFEELYDLLVPRIFGLIYRLITDRDHAEEVTQEVFLEIWQKAATYQGSASSVSTWVTMVAHRRAVDRIRSVQSSLNRDIAQGKLGFTETYEHVHQTVQQHLDHDEVQSALATLSPEHRSIIELSYFGGLTHHQIADNLNLPLGTVKSRMRAALSKLRLALGDTDD